MDHTFTVSELSSIALGVGSTIWLFAANRQLFGKGTGFAFVEAIYYLVAAGALYAGWYFNFEYMRQYEGVSGWWHWTTLLFVNPASASGGQDLIFANVVLFPLWTILEGRRRKMKVYWLYFPVSIVTSFAFAMALFLAFEERQIRWLKAQGQN